MNITRQLQEDKYVVFLDVLGFTKMVHKKDELLDQYYEIMFQYTDRLKESNQIQSLLISDSTILCASVSNENLTALFVAIQDIQIACAIKGIWIRGAISIGDCAIVESQKLAVGNGLIKALILEKEAKVPRVIIDPKIVAHYRTREAFVQQFNSNFVGPGSMPNLIPLIADPTIFKDSSFTDAFFVTYAEKLALAQIENVNAVYLHIKTALYGDYSTYSKYFWLKNYFTIAFERLACTDTIADRNPLWDDQRLRFEAL